jgi:replicative DNA helicase
VTVSDELTKRGEISRIGGPAYLHTLIQSVPTAANAGFYAEIVRERAVLRRLVDAGTKIVQLGYSNDGEVDDIVNAAQAEVYAVAERRTAEDYVALKDIIEGTVDEIESAGHRGEGMTGVPTGFYELDELTQGLHGGQMIVVAARPAMGKSTVRARLGALGRHQAQSDDCVSSPWKWGATRSRCACSQRRPPSACRTCAREPSRTSSGARSPPPWGA